MPKALDGGGVGVGVGRAETEAEAEDGRELEEDDEDDDGDRVCSGRNMGSAAACGGVDRAGADDGGDSTMRAASSRPSSPRGSIDNGVGSSCPEFNPTSLSQISGICAAGSQHSQQHLRA